MDLVETEDNQEGQEHIEGHISEAILDHSFSVDCTGADDIYEDPPIQPRLGDQYQVEIPSLMSESERQQLCLTPIYSGAMLGIGLAIPIMWVPHEGNYTKQEEQQFSHTSTNAEPSYTCNGVLPTAPECIKPCEYSPQSIQSQFTSSQGLTCKFERQDKLSGHDQELAGSSGQVCKTTVEQMFVGGGSVQPIIARRFSPLPGSPAASWSEAEAQCFLLGLYIFGKNLVQIRKFVDGKEMGDVLSFYYGKFYRSNAYRRWSECRKMKSRRCIYGQRIFTGWRQQVLLSRLLPSIAKEAQDNLIEATKMFSEGRVSFEEFIFSLKAMVGGELLIKAVGIGKGKHDLTGIVLDPFRTNQAISARPEIPVGKACSSLTSGDIINFLTGDFRLSKAKSNDLFWEAVWPRLLARGWHSEQPKDLSSVGLKNSLVFLIPGVKKFSRKLVRGNHYFDSVSDVLNKVASDPRLLDLEVEEAIGSSSNKVQNINLDQKGLGDHQRSCYLRSKLPKCNSEFMKFTVVDTSLVQGEGPFKVREVRTLPADANCSIGASNSSGDVNSASSPGNTNSTSTSLTEDGEYEPVTSDDKELGNIARCKAKPLLNENEDSCPVSSDEKILTDNRMCMLGKSMEPDINDHLNPLSIGRMLVNGHDSNNEPHNLWHNKHLVKDKSSQTSCCFDSTQPKFLASVSKRRRLAGCKYTGTGRRSFSFLKSHQLKKEETELNSHSTGQIIGAETGPSLLKISSGSSVKSVPDMDNDCTRRHCGTDDVSESLLSEEKVQSRALIDLNLPHFPPDVETVDPLSLHDTCNQDKMNGDDPPFPSETQQQRTHIQSFTSNVMHSLDQPTMLNARRQSTRNRPPTTKALEAFASGLLSTGRRGRSTSTSLSNTTSRSSRRDK